MGYQTFFRIHFSECRFSEWKKFLKDEFPNTVIPNANFPNPFFLMNKIPNTAVLLKYPIFFLFYHGTDFIFGYYRWSDANGYVSVYS